MRTSAVNFSASSTPPSVRRYMRLLLFVVATGMVAGCDASAERESNAETPLELETVRAEVVSLELRPWPTVVRSQGSLYADEQSVVGAKVAGRVAEVHADLGDFVQRGDPLVTLDQEEFRLQVEQAEAQLQQARSAVGLRENDPVEKLDPQNAPPVRQEKALWEETQSTLRRSADLLKQNAVSQGEYDQAAAAERVAEARYASALNGVQEKIALIGVRQAELSLARQRLADATIRAPLTGYVRQRHVALGAYLAVGQPIAVMVRTHPLRFRGTVPERYAQSLAVGQEVRLKIESVDQPRTAKISRISPALDPQSRALAFEAEIDNSDFQLRAGLFVEAEVVVDPAAEALVIPHSAIIEFAGAQKVWKVVDGVAAEQEVLGGAKREQGHEILQGLNVGDVILIDAAEGRIARIEPVPAPDSASATADSLDDGARPTSISHTGS